MRYTPCMEPSPRALSVTGHPGAQGTASYRICPQFEREAASRLRVLVVALTCGFALDLGFSLVSIELFGWERQPATSRVRLLELAMLAASGLLLFSWRLRPRLQLRLGRVYQLCGALFLILTHYWGDQGLQSNPTRVSWLGIWILLFPLIIPARPWRHAFSALLQATAAPVCFGVWLWFHNQTVPSVSIWIPTFLPNFLCAGLALVPAFLIYQWGRSFREMRKTVHTLGSYELIKPLGKGAMGEVWSARHRFLARTAAVKLIQPAVLDDVVGSAQRQRILARFEREARATAFLSSPHSVSLFDYGRTPDGTFYYVMEELQGIDFQTLVQRFGPLPPERVVYLLAQVCDSLAEAHAADLVHRDIKPANLFTCRAGLRCDFVKVLDFGLVADMGLNVQESARLTMRGAILGTPAYMAPEQSGGKTLDARADCYSLGCVAYYLLSGRLVFEGDTPFRVMVEHMTADPAPPSSRTSQTIPAELDALILSCLAKEPYKRPSSAELGRQFRAWALRWPWQEQALPWWRQNIPELLAEGSSPEDAHPTERVEVMA